CAPLSDAPRCIIAPLELILDAGAIPAPDCADSPTFRLPRLGFDKLGAPLQVEPDRPRPFVVPILSRLHSLAHLEGQHARMIVDDDVLIPDGEQSNVVRAVVEQVAGDAAAAAEEADGERPPVPHRLVARTGAEDNYPLFVD